ncbi:hypothetical protein [Halomarina rubra]|uniref:Uncharacterized protein n=1 Tax=Halomarina rubra TaxID=2071873 RepID=A0ABD6AWX8_9EURY|nr:hypothetical protein [Halomarina rubra]
MNRTSSELVYDLLLVLASGLGVVTYMLAILMSPALGAGASLILVVLGLFTLVPAGKRVPAGMIGITAVALAGIVIPRAVSRVDSAVFPLGNEMTTTLLVSGIVLLVTFALVRVTAFQPEPRHST